MFAWLVNLFRKQPEAHGVFRPKDLFIYEFFNGEKQVKEDPLIIHQRLTEVWAELMVDLQIVFSPIQSALTSDKFRIEAKLLAAEKIRKAFDIKPAKEGGLDADSCLELFHHYWSWADSLKKDTEPSPTFSRDGSKPTEKSPAESQGMSISSASGSTASESSTGRPEPSPSVLVSPTVT